MDLKKLTNLGSHYWPYIHVHTIGKGFEKQFEFDRMKQGKYEWFGSCDQPSNLTQIGFKPLIFQPVWPWNLMDDLEKTTGHLFYTMSSFVHHFKSICEFILKLKSGNAQFGSKLVIFCPVRPRWMTLENNRAPLLYYVTLYASFHSHGWIQTRVTVPKLSIWVKIDFFSQETLKFDRWTWTRQIWGIW